MNLRLLVLSLGSLLLGTVAHAQPVKVKDDLGLPSASVLAPAPMEFRPVARDAVQPSAVEASPVSRTDSVTADVGPRTAPKDTGSRTSQAAVPDRRLDPVRKPDRSDPRDPVVRVGNATATLLTGVASTTFGLCYWKYHRRIDRQIEDAPINPLGLAIAATLAIPAGAVLTWAGITMLF